MPLGLMPGMTYEEREVQLEPGDSVLFYSDGLIEAHDPRYEMFGFPGLQARMATHAGGTALIPFLLSELAAWTGAGWEQEDDVTLLVLERDLTPLGGERRVKSEERSDDNAIAQPQADSPSAPYSLPLTPYADWRVLVEFSVPSERGNERAAMEQAAAAISTERGMLAPARLQKLKTAVAEATMNAIEHGNGYRADVPVRLQVLANAEAVAVRITDEGGDKPATTAEMPDLEAKLAGLQSPRGWGLFLIEKMVDEMRIHNENGEHTVELVLYREGEPDGSHDS
jgi:anti-sigma regulatory factor (Ser/Thr protein kinase)